MINKIRSRQKKRSICGKKDDVKDEAAAESPYL